MPTEIILTNAQQEAFTGLLEGTTVGSVLALKAPCGMGKTTILKKIHAARGGILLGTRELVAGLMSDNAAGIEEAFLRMIDDAMQTARLVIVDDLHLVTNVVESWTYPRKHLLDAALTSLLAEASVMKKTLIFASSGELPWPIS